MDSQTYLFFGIFLLIMTRIMGVFLQAPVFSSRNIPYQVKIGLTALISLVLFSQVAIPKDFPNNLGSFIALLVMQFLVGSVIGYVSYIVMAAVQFAGEILDIQIGLSAASVYDASTGDTTNLLRRFEFYFATIIYLIIDGHHVLLKAIQKSFEFIPLDGMAYTGALVNQLVVITMQIFYIGVQISAPMIIALLIVQIALGLLSRVAPQMNVFMLSFAVNILVGVGLLWVCLPYISLVLEKLFSQNFRDIIQAINYMRIQP